MRTAILRAIWLVITLTLLALCFTGQTSTRSPHYDERLQSLRDELRERIQTGELPSVSVGVVKGGKAIWKGSFGFADIEKRIKATPFTVYALGSLSKSITGTAVFKLVQDGKIDLDRPVDNYLRTRLIGVHGGNANDLKVFHLLNMAAGIPHFWRYCYVSSGNLSQCGDELLDQASFSAFKPGEVHLYSNLSFAIAAQMVEDVSRVRFRDYLRTAILKPAGMRHTFTHLNELRDASLTVARPYKRDGTPADAFQFEPAGGGGFYSSVDDLLKYAAIHLPHRNDRRAILNNRTIAEDHRVRPELPHRYYANGWGVLPLPNGWTTLLSNGAIEGAATTLLVLPDSDLAIVVLVNKTVGNDPTDDLAFRIAGAMLPGYKKGLDELFAKVGPEFEDKPYENRPDSYGIWIGKVLIGGERVKLSLRISGDGLFLSLDDSDPRQLTDLRLSDGLVVGTLALKAPSELGIKSRSVKVFVRITGDKLTGFIQDEVLEPRPDRLLAYFISASKEQ